MTRSLLGTKRTSPRVCPILAHLGAYLVIDSKSSRLVQTALAQGLRLVSGTTVEYLHPKHGVPVRAHMLALGQVAQRLRRTCTSCLYRSWKELSGGARTHMRTRASTGRRSRCSCACSMRRSSAKSSCGNCRAPHSNTGPLTPTAYHDRRRSCSGCSAPCILCSRLAAWARSCRRSDSCRTLRSSTTLITCALRTRSAFSAQASPKPPCRVPSQASPQTCASARPTRCRQVGHLPPAQTAESPLERCQRPS